MADEKNMELKDEAMANATGGFDEDLDGGANWWQKYSDKPPKFAQNTAVYWRGREESYGIGLVKRAEYIGAPKLGVWGLDVEFTNDKEYVKKIPEIELYRP